jgi:hypothetical protein
MSQPRRKTMFTPPKALPLPHEGSIRKTLPPNLSPPAIRPRSRSNSKNSSKNFQLNRTDTEKNFHRVSSTVNSPENISTFFDGGHRDSLMPQNLYDNPQSYDFMGTQGKRFTMRSSLAPAIINILPDPNVKNHGFRTT